MDMNEDEKMILFRQNQKVKVNSYAKHFRVDGKFSLSKAIDLMRAYFPIEELTNEALQ